MAASLTFQNKKDKFFEELSLIAIKYQPMFNEGDQLSNHYIFDEANAPTVTFTFIKGSGIPSAIKQKCKTLFAKFFDVI